MKKALIVLSRIVAGLLALLLLLMVCNVEYSPSEKQMVMAAVITVALTHGEIIASVPSVGQMFAYTPEVYRAAGSNDMEAYGFLFLNYLPLVVWIVLLLLAAYAFSGVLNRRARKRAAAGKPAKGKATTALAEAGGKLHSRVRGLKASLSTPGVCPSCGGTVGPTDVTCARCGKALPRASAPAVRKPTPRVPTPRVPAKPATAKPAAARAVADRDVCPKCGAKLVPGDAFCVICGARVAAPDAPMPAAAPAPATPAYVAAPAPTAVSAPVAPAVSAKLPDAPTAPISAEDSAAPAELVLPDVSDLFVPKTTAPGPKTDNPLLKRPEMD